MSDKPIKNALRGIDFENVIDRNKLEITHKAIIEILDNFDTGSLNQDITRKDLNTFTINKWFNVNQGVRVRRRHDLVNDTMVFDTVMIQGARFALHYHSDLVEQITVVEGELVDLNTKSHFLPNESVVFPMGQIHTPVALKYTVLRVYFF